MFSDQKKQCVFANKFFGVRCQALEDYMCENELCPFFKSKEYYNLDKATGFCIKKPRVK